MPFNPDVVVVEPGSFRILLIAQAKIEAEELGFDSQVKQYMCKTGCAVGLLAFPDRLVVYRNQFTGLSDDYIRLVGAFPSPRRWAAFDHRRTEFHFAKTVQDWLAALRTNATVSDAPIETQEALKEHVLPSLVKGEIQESCSRKTKT